MAKKKTKVEEGPYYQLELIPLTPIEQLHKDFEKVKESTEKVRKGLFKRHTDMSKKMDEMKCEIESLKHQLQVVHSFLTTIPSGFVPSVQENPEESGRMITSARGTKIHAMFADQSLTLLHHATLDTRSSKEA